MAMRKCLMVLVILSVLFAQMPVAAFAAGADLTVIAENGEDGEKGQDQTQKQKMAEMAKMAGTEAKRPFPTTGNAAVTARSGPAAPIRRRPRTEGTARTGSRFRWSCLTRASASSPLQAGTAVKGATAAMAAMAATEETAAAAGTAAMQFFCRFM